MLIFALELKPDARPIKRLFVVGGGDGRRPDHASHFFWDCRLAGRAGKFISGNRRLVQ